MNRREFLTITSGAGVGMLTGGHFLENQSAWGHEVRAEADGFKLLPFPQSLERTGGRFQLGRPRYVTAGKVSRTKEVAMDSLRRFLPATGKTISVRLGSAEEGYDPGWLRDDENEFLVSDKTSREASILAIGFNGFVFEDPEANHVPNQNEQCYKTFWEPWASTYGYSSIQQTNHGYEACGRPSPVEARSV